MKKTLFPLAILGLVFASPVFAKSVTNIVKVKGMSQISDSGDSIDVYTTKGTIAIHVEYIDEKSFDVLYKATKNKSCVKITRQGDFPGPMKAVKVTCPKKLPAIKY